MEVAHSHSRLTSREKEVLVLLVQGLNYTQVASELTVAYNTVKTHASAIFTKLNVHDRTQAVLKAIKEGLV